MGCCLNPIAPKSQLDFASLEERNMGLHQIPITVFSQRGASEDPQTLPPNKLVSTFKNRSWGHILEGNSMAFYILTHPSLLNPQKLVQKDSIIALAMLYAQATPNVRADLFLLKARTEDILKSMAHKMLKIAARVVPLYLEEKKKEVDKVASEDEINIVLDDFMAEALGVYKSYSYKWLSQFVKKQGGFILSPEKIREKFSMKYFNELIGTRDEEGGDQEEGEDSKEVQEEKHQEVKVKGHKAEQELSQKSQDKNEKEEEEKIIQSEISKRGGKQEEEKMSESDQDQDEEEDIEVNDTGVVQFNLTLLKKEKIPRSKCTFNAYIEHQFDQENCCDITHTIDFLYLEKLVRLAKYAWKRSEHYCQPLLIIFQKLIDLIAKSDEAEQKMKNLHKFLNRHYKSQTLDQLYYKCVDEQKYHSYYTFLRDELEEVDSVKDMNKLALVALKALNNQPDNLRSACSQTNRTVIRKRLDLPYDGEFVGGLKFVEFFVDCCASIKKMIPEAADYICINILQRALSPVISEDQAYVISSKECSYSQGHDKELKSENYIPLQQFREIISKAEEKFGESLKIAGLEEIKQEEEEIEEKEESVPEEKEQEEVEEEEPKAYEEEEEEKLSKKSEEQEEQSPRKEESEHEEQPPTEEEKLVLPTDIIFNLTNLKSQKIPRSKCAFNAFIEHQFDQETCCDITHTIGFSYLEKLVRLAKYAWKQSVTYFKPMGVILLKHIELIAKEPHAHAQMKNLHNFLDNYVKDSYFQDLLQQSQEENEYSEYSAYVQGQLSKVEDTDQIDEISILAIKALNNYAGNLRSACSETNRNVIRKHVDLPYDGEQIGGISFIEYFIECCAQMKGLIPSASDYIRTNILQKALNGVVAENQTHIISSKWCDLEQGHDKELKSMNLIPGQLYKDLIKRAEEIYGESLEVEALVELKAEIEVLDEDIVDVKIEAEIGIGDEEEEETQAEDGE